MPARARMECTHPYVGKSRCRCSRAGKGRKITACTAGVAGVAGAADVAGAEGVWRDRRTGADLTGHMNITRPLCTLSGPTNRSLPDAKMVTECAKCVPAPRDAPAPAMLSGLNGVPATGGPSPHQNPAHISGMSGSRGAHLD